MVSGQLSTGDPPSAASALFLVKLSADGAQVTAGPQGIGGLVAADAQYSIYVAGLPLIGTNGPPSTPGAFQGMPELAYCGCPFLNFPCGVGQFVASLTQDLSRTRFLTYVTAKFGTVSAYVAVDAESNILIAGTTSAPGYPTLPIPTSQTIRL